MKHDPVTKSGHSPTPDNPEGIIYLLRKYGVYNLGGSDGCACCSFQIGAFHVVISCHKSHDTLRVFSGYMWTAKDLEVVAQVVAEELVRGGIEVEYVRSLTVRFCDYNTDHFNGRWVDGIWMEQKRCAWCHADRPVQNEYLCDKCLLRSDVKDYYPWVEPWYPVLAQETVG